MASNQSDLFGGPVVFPDGFRYQPALLPESEAEAVVQSLASLPFKAFEFHGFLGKRRVVSFGWRYDFNGGGLTKTEDMPQFLLALREKAGAFAEIPPSSLQQVLVTEYRPGAAIGWHKDRSVFGDVVGISLVAPCSSRFRRRKQAGWERTNLTLEPRSVYHLRGSSRSEWEHSIPAVDSLRYSLTFRNVLQQGS
jgi:alkylated DNA repair dioxygenase AlkB